jgi:DNA-binding transcriptional regulator YiaG
VYHYKESGLPNVYLVNGYREVATAYGRGIAIEDVEGLHMAIGRDLVEAIPVLSGLEARFIRKLLGLTQEKLAEFLGVEDQSIRRWEKLANVPKQADRAIRLVFRDLTRRSGAPLPKLTERIDSEDPEKRSVRYRFKPRAAEHWRPERTAA